MKEGCWDLARAQMSNQLGSQKKGSSLRSLFSKVASFSSVTSTNSDLSRFLNKFSNILDIFFVRDFFVGNYSSFANASTSRANALHFLTSRSHLFAHVYCI